MGFPGSAMVKNPPASAGDRRVRVWSLSWEDPMDRGAWRVTVHRVTVLEGHSPGLDWSDLARMHADINVNSFNLFAKQSGNLC